MLDVCLLGTGGAIPKLDRWLSSALLRYNGSSVVIDCGEGTQLALKAAGFTFKQIDIILITHFHADHISGLPGMLLSMGNEGRTEAVTIAGPKGLSKVVSSLCSVAPNLQFPVNVYEFPSKGGSLPSVYTPWDEYIVPPLTISSLPLKHSLPCLGYRISLVRAGKFDPDRAKENGIPLEYWGRLQKGETIKAGRKTFKPEMVLGPERKGIDVSFITDTRPFDGIADFVKGSDLLISEVTFPAEKKQRAIESFHMTSEEVADIAKKAEVGKLWMTHYSPSMPDPEEAYNEIKELFPSVTAAYDGMRELIKFED